MLDSPAEDFSKTTLAAVAGTLGKLQYIAGLRQGNGEYFHWGMTRMHGEASASLAIAQAHTGLFLTLLRTPLRALWEEAGVLAREQGADVGEYLRKLTEAGDALIPLHLQGGGRHHFNSVLLALGSLARAEERRAGQAA